MAIGLGWQMASAAESPVDPVAEQLRWRMIGPYRGGRTRAVTGIPGRPETFLIGAVNGGVWKTDDYGRTWNPIFDAQPTQSIGAIAVAPSDPQIIYVGSGEGLHRPDLSVGDGIYRSADLGKTWVHRGLEDAEQVPDLAIDPRDPDLIYAAVLGHPFGPSSQRGIFRSHNGGEEWTRILYVDENTGGSCIKIDPHDPNTLYAALWNVRSGPWEDNNVYNGGAGGLYKSSDGGEHWHKLTNGLPENLSQIEIAVAPSLRNRLYATVATTASGDYSSAAGLGVYRSDDGGESWMRITDDPRPALRIGGGDIPIIKVDPLDANVLYSASIVTVKSVDAGVHWSSLRGAPGGDDYQNLWISPDDSRHIALVSDQGGVITVNGGRTWSSWFNQPTAQLYHIGMTNQFPYSVCSGQQESGSVCISSRGNDGTIRVRDWRPVGVIEYGYVVPDPLDPDIVYGAGRNEVTRTHLATGEVQNITPIPLKGAGIRVDRTEPLFFSPQNAHKMYYAANRLYETEDAGRSWRAVSPDLSREDAGVPASVGTLVLPEAIKQRGVIYAAGASSVEEGLIWLGTDDGLIWVGHGTHWQNVTPADLGPWSKVTQIEASHFDAQTAYASVSRLRLDDMKPYLYRTRDGGKSWQLMISGLPDNSPANTVREDPVRRGLLYAGTEKAVWVSFDEGDHWGSLQLNLPHTSMRDLAVHGTDLIVATHGRSFWILDDVSPLRKRADILAAREAILLPPAEAIQIQRSTNTDTPVPPDEPYGRNPPDGAVIDYYLVHAAKQPVSIEVRDASGALIRRVSNRDPVAFTEEELNRELIPPYWIRRPAPLATTAGMHRWVWDLRYATPRTAQRGFPISDVPGDTPQDPLGPLVTPGSYTIRLYVGEHQWDQSIRVIADPRLKVTAVQLDAQHDLAMKLAGALDASTGALFEARSLRAQLKSITALKGGTLSAQIKSLDQRIADVLNASSETPEHPAHPGIDRQNGDLATLYGQVMRTKAEPTRAQVDASDATILAWQLIEAEWQNLRRDLAALNRELGRAKLPLLRPELAPPRQLDMADVE
jgi:photosystem II stability/assembly factor-like uncharacterized protein